MNTIFTLLLAILAFAVKAHSDSGFGPNPFLVPFGGYKAQTGQQFAVYWTATTSGTITLYMQNGSAPLSSPILVAKNLRNSGQYEFDLMIAPGPSFRIEIVSDEDWSQINYTPYFAITSGVSGLVPAYTVASTVSSQIQITSTTTPTATATAPVVYTQYGKPDPQFPLRVGLGVGITGGLLLLVLLIFLTREREARRRAAQGLPTAVTAASHEPKPAPPYTPAANPPRPSEPLNDSDLPLESPPPSYDTLSHQLGSRR